MLAIYDMPGHLIWRMHQISSSIFLERVSRAGYDLTPVQFAALSAINTYPGLDQATIAGMIAYDRVTIGGVVDRLEQKGLVSRVVSKRDRRARELESTENGCRLARKLEKIVQEIQLEILSGLDHKEKVTFIKLLKKATDAGNELSRAPLKVSPQEVM